jgi:hypothetical protein
MHVSALLSALRADWILKNQDDNSDFGDRWGKANIHSYADTEGNLKNVTDSLADRLIEVYVEFALVPVIGEIISEEALLIDPLAERMDAMATALERIQNSVDQNAALTFGKPSKRLQKHGFLSSIKEADVDDKETGSIYLGDQESHEYLTGICMLLTLSSLSKVLFLLLDRRSVHS